MTEETRFDEAVRQTQLATTILIVDDSPMDRRIAGSVVERHPGWKAVYATDGREALPLLQKEMPDLILTDMLMPQMNGLELLHAARNLNPDISVVLMTASGSEELANHALRHGAASYVPKTNLARDLATTLEQVLAAGQGIGKAPLLPSLARIECDFVLENDPTLVRAHVLHMQEDLARLRLCTRTRRSHRHGPRGSDVQRHSCTATWSWALTPRNMASGLFSNCSWNAALSRPTESAVCS